MHKFTKALAAIGLAAVMSQSAMAENLKLGFLVKQPEEPWFQTEWKFADKAGKDLGFEVIKIAVPDGEKTLNAIDSLAASGAKGFVICTPDPKLGSAIVAKARGYDMKVIAVDDQFVNAKGKPMDTVPLVMMAATKIGERQGQELYKEMQKRGWDVKESAVMAITSNELDTARRRTTGSMDALKAAGFPEKQIYQVPTKSNDIPGAFDAANSMLVQHPEVKHWLIVGMNDSTVLGGVRATEGQGFKAADIIGIGINGVDAVSELSKAQATGFYGSLLPSPDVHGYKSSEMLYNWVAKGVEPTKFTEVTDVVLITRDNFNLKTTSLYVTHDQVEAMTLAQRVMVMNGGVAEQIGTPVEVYEKPASLFVASFIGSPAMNLLAGRVNNEGTHFELDGGIALPLNGGYRQYVGRKMTLGIRPEHIALSSQAEGGVPLVMDTLEILGADNLAHGHWGEQKLVVRLAHQERPTAGSTLWLHLPENQLHLFDGETGQRV
ncbi:hypothetical protein WP5S18E09_20040 [Escherichia coli]|nr:hypothetical protein WP5S18E09_20040 [Escherichia coli]